MQGVELELTPAETSQEATGERLSGEVDVGSNGMGLREGLRQTGRWRGTGVGAVCLLLTAENQWMCSWTCTHACMYTSFILVRTFNGVMHSQAPDPNPIPNLALLILMLKPSLKPQTHLQSCEDQAKCPRSASGRCILHLNMWRVQ